MSTKPPAPAVTCGRTPSFETLTEPWRSICRKDSSEQSKPDGLEVGELMRRGHDGLGIRGAAELEIEQRHAADRALLDHPGGLAVQALLDEDARHIGRDAEAEIDRPALLQLLRHAARDRLADPELHQGEARQRPEDFARDRRIIGRLRRLPLIGRLDDIVDENARHAHVMRLERPGLGDALHLRDDLAAGVMRRHRKIERAEIGAFLLES